MWLDTSLMISHTDPNIALDRNPASELLHRSQDCPHIVAILCWTFLILSMIIIFTNPQVRPVGWALTQEIQEKYLCVEGGDDSWRAGPEYYFK